MTSSPCLPFYFCGVDLLVCCTRGESPEQGFVTYGAFHFVAWHSSVQFGSGRIVFPLQFSTALEWAGLFTCCYSCAASTAVTPEKLFHSASLHHLLAGSSPRLSMRGTSVLPQHSCTSETAIFWLLKERCAHSKQLRLILRWLCWFKSSGSVVSCAASSMAQAVMIFSGQSVISRVYTSHFGNGTVRLESRPRWY